MGVLRVLSFSGSASGAARRPGATCTLATVVCAALTLAGCARFQPQPLSPAVNAAALDARTLADPRLHRLLLATLPGGHRTASDTDWTLDKLSLAALYYHPDLAVAGAKLALAQGRVVTAGQRPNPTLNLTAVYGSPLVSSAAFPVGAAPLIIGPVINVLIETFGKREDRTAQARHLANAARSDLATAAWQVRGRVRTALLNLWAARRRLELARNHLSLRRQLVTLLEQRLIARFATSLDVARERIALAKTNLSIRDLIRLEAEARVQVATAVGVPVHALDGVTLSVAAFDHAGMPAAGLSSGPLRRRALTGRTDVQARLAQYEAAQSALKLQIANQYPNIILGPGYNCDIGTNRFIFNPAADLPIFNQNQGPIADAVARRRQAAAQFTALQAQVIGQIDAAAAAYRATSRTLGSANAPLARERTRQGQARAAFKAGGSDRPTLVTAGLEAAVIRTSRFDALVAQRQAIEPIMLCR